ncbi:hypothetical protein ACHWQZ_G004823 [Mnemiopsis leidyi]
MSDSEDDERVTKLNFKKDRIHFGSLEDAKILAAPETAKPVEEGEKMVEFSATGDKSDTESDNSGEEDLSGVQTLVDEHQAQLWDELAKKKAARNIAVPTEDKRVKDMLREMEEPICLFGEGPYERRERLKKLLVAAGKLSGVTTHQDLVAEQEKQEDSEEMEDKPEVWYHEGTGALKRARFFIAEYSVPRAKKRLQLAREWQSKPATMKHSEKQDIHKFVHTLNNECSQIGDTRPLSYCNISPCSGYLATGSWSGLVKLWKLPSCNPVATLSGHNGRVGAVTFSPQAGLAENVACLASCDSDGLVNLWSMASTRPVANLPGHGCRVARLNYHPSGRFLGTACYDHSWRFWDLETSSEILHQEGHSGPVYSISFHRDGSLLATGGLDSYCRVWDLRTGRAVLFLEGHLKSVLSCDFAPDGYHLGTGSEDNSCKIWDLRQCKSIYSIPAHNNMVTFCKFAGTSNNSMLLTASYDSTAKVWSHKGWMPLKSLSGHDNKVMCVDCSWEKKYIVTASYDRTFKLWTNKSIS